MSKGKCIIAVVGVLLLLGVIGALVGCGEEPAATPTVYEDSDNYKGFHCLSAWDGNHDGLEALVRDVLNDPDSMETYETRITPNRDGKHEVRVEFGAKNAFGGMIRHTAVGEVDNASCDAILLDVFVRN